jgi:hypothetical protein
MTAHARVTQTYLWTDEIKKTVRWRPAGLEHWIVAICLCVVMVHFVDATTLHWQRGVGAPERLAQFVVAITLPAAAIISYPRLRCGWRAALLFGFGFPAVTSGFVIHVVGAIKNGIGSGDYTGFALLAAGTVLVVLALAVLFISLPGWWWRAVAVPVVAVTGMTFALPAAIAVYVTHAPRYEISAVDLGKPYEDASFETQDGLTIRGWYVPSSNGAALIVLHGSGGARIRPVDHARILVDHGYGVLLIDVRGHGESEGATNALGWGAWPDVLAAVEFLNGRPDVEDGRVGVMGVSMGAEIGLDAVSRTATVRALVADGAGVRSINELRTLPLTLSRAQEYPSYAVSNLAVRLLSGEPPPSAIEDRLAMIDTPTLLISSKVAEERDINRIWHEKMEGIAELWELADTGHTAGLRMHPAEYEDRVVGFFDEHLLR